MRRVALNTTGSTTTKKRTRPGCLVVRHGRKRNEIITDLPSRRDVLRGQRNSAAAVPVSADRQAGAGRWCCVACCHGGIRCAGGGDNQDEDEMTEQQAHIDIGLWRHYTLRGAPDEPDYGDPSPCGIKSAGLESQYRSPQIWDDPEPKASPDDIRAAYHRVDAVYNSMSQPDRRHVIGWYFGDRNSSQKEAQQRFFSGVVRL